MCKLTHGFWIVVTPNLDTTQIVFEINGCIMYWLLAAAAAAAAKCLIAAKNTDLLIQLFKTV